MSKVLKRIKLILDKYSPSPKMYSFRMSEEEIALFDKYVKLSKGYLEFGSGGSTFHALKKSKVKVYSIDSDILWINKLRDYVFIRFMELRRLTFLFVNIGPIREWGYPVSNDFSNRFPDYSEKVFRIVDMNYIDMVFIDGRFRVACALKTILESKRSDMTILVHDFISRPYYHIILKYLVEIERARTLVVFKIISDIDRVSVLKDYGIYKFIPY